MKYVNEKVDSEAIVLLSGGQDSTTCLFWAKEKFSHVIALSFDFGQKHIRELESAKQICNSIGIEHTVLNLNVMGDLRNDKGFISGRNLFFISFAALFAQKQNIKNIVIGVSQEDYRNFPDCRDIFIKSLTTALDLGMDFEFRIHTPLIDFNKKETWKLADDLGIMNIIENDTVTCYGGIPGKGCGNCPACQLRNEGYSEYIKDKEAEKQL